MTPHRGNTLIFRSSEQLPRLRLGLLMGTVLAQKGSPHASCFASGNTENQRHRQV